MKDKRVLIRAAAGVLIVAAAVLYLVIRPAVVRSRIEKDFTPSDLEAKTQYRTCSSMEEMDLEAFGSYLSWPRTAVGNPDHTILLPCDVNYYTMEGGSRVTAFTQKKGTVITIPGSGLLPGEGYLSYPTFEKGWRYTKAFTENGKDPDDHYYYVKLSELEEVFKGIRTNYASITEASGAAGKDLNYNAVRLIDRIFYHEGIYCSQDLTKYPVTEFGK